MSSDIKKGVFTELADNYTKYRPGYSNTIANALLGTVNKPKSEVDFADVGAGTGIWTSQMLQQGLRSVVAVEPNDAMRAHGMANTDDSSVDWIKGTGEQTNLADESADLLTMASSFHWVDFEKGLREFHRVLRKDGVFAALWNPRDVAKNPLLQEIEDYLYSLKPSMSRVSSGRSSFTETLKERLSASELFTDVVYLEGSHMAELTKEHYLGVWRSVNDIQAQLGSETFEKFMSFIDKKIADGSTVACHYNTVLWAARKR